MATRIPIPQYQQRSAPALEQPAARAPMAAVEDNSAQALASVGNALQRVGDVVKQQDAEDARAWVSKASSTDVVKWQDRLTQLKEAAQPGAPDFTPNLLKEYDDYRQQALANAPDDTTRRFYGMQLDQLRQTLGTQAVHWEAGQREAHRVNQYTDAAEADATAIARDPSLYGERRAALMAVLNTSGMNPETKSKLQVKAEQTLAYAAGSRMVVDNPAATLAVLQRKPDDPVPDGYEWVSRLDGSKIVPLITKAQGYVHAQEAARLRAQQQVERDQLARENAATDAYNSAFDLASKGRYFSTEFISSTADTVAGTAMEKPFRELVQAQSQVAGFAGLSLPQQQAVLERQRAAGSDPNVGVSPIEQKVYEQQKKIFEASTEAYKENPWQAAQERGVIQDAPVMQVGTIQDAEALIAKRMGTINQVEIAAGRRISPLQPAEAEQIGRTVRALPPDQQASALASFGQLIGDPDRLAQVAKQIGDKDNVLGVAMSYANAKTTLGRYTSELILRGERALKDNAVTIDSHKETGWKGEIAKTIGDAIPDQNLDRASKQAAYLIMAGIAASGDTPDVKRAVGMAIGNIVDQRDGSKVPLPYGMKEDTFRDKIKSMTPTDLVAQGAVGGTVYVGKQPVPLETFVKQLPDASLMHAGQGRYAVKAGSGLVTLSPGGKPLIIRVPQ